MISTLIRSSLIAAVSIAAITSCDMSSNDVTRVTDDYVTIIITQRDQHDVDYVSDVVSINIDDSRVARTIFAASDNSANIITLNDHAVQITLSDLYSVCDALDATDIECFS